MSITAANAVFTLSIPPLFTTPQQIQGFGTDDVADVPAIKSVEVMMGIDGILSFGFVYVAVPMEVMLQADSASNAVFDTWWNQMQAAQDSYAANGLVKLPGISTKFTLTNGGLTSYKPMPGIKKLLQMRRFEITFQKIKSRPRDLMDDAVKCMRCEGDHPVTRCSLVKAVEFHESGDLKRIEFLTAADFPESKDEADQAERPPNYRTLQPGWKGQNERPKG